MSRLLLDPLGAWRTRHVLLGPQAAWDLDQDAQRYDGFETWCAAHPGVRCDAAVSAHCSDELPVAPEAARLDDAALLGWARLQLLAYGGESAAAASCAAWSSRGARGVSVLQGLDLAGLQAAARQHRVRLAGVRPWWSVALRVHRARLPRRGPARLVVLESARWVAIDLADRVARSVAAGYLDEASAAALSTWAAERNAAPTWAVGYGLAAGELRGVTAWSDLYATAPPAWTP